MPRLQIDLDAATAESLASLAVARGTTPADFVAELVLERVRVPASQARPDPLDAIAVSIDADPDDGYRAPPDPMDELLGKYSGDRVNDSDEVVYGR